MFVNPFRSLVKRLGRRQNRSARRPRLARYRLILEMLETRSLPSSTAWTGQSVNPDHLWSDARNWSNGVPGAGDTAVFTHPTSGDTTVNVDGAFTVGTVNVDATWGGAINVNNPLSINAGLGLASGSFNVGAATTVAGASRWAGGTISIGFRQTLTQTGTLTLANAATSPVTLNGDGTLVNTGTIEQDGATDLNMQSGGINNLTTLINQGTYDFQTDTGISSNSGGGTFNNQGILSKSAGRTNASSTISVLLLSSSEIDVNAGVLRLQSNGGSLTGGTFNVVTGATLDLTGGTNVNYTGTFTGSGGGTISLSSGDLLIGSAGATFNFPAPLFQWSGGTLTVPFQGQPLVNAGTMTLGNSATVLVTLNGDGTLLNQGTIEQDGANDLNIQSSGINNLTTLLNQGTYDFQTDTGISSNSGGGTFNNQGVLSKSAGRANSFSAITVLMNNSSEVDANAGNLKLAAGGGVLNGGIYNAASGATLDLIGGATVTVSGTLADSGAEGGNVVLSGGDLAVDPVNGATFAFDPGVFQWTGGTISVSFQAAALTNAGDITLANSGLATLNGDGTFINAGTIEQTGPGDLNMQSSGINNLTTLINQAGAVYNIQADSGISSNSGGGTFINQGTLQKSSGNNTSTISVVFSNSDTPGNPNSDLVLAGSGRLDFTGSFTQTAGAINLAGGAVGAGNNGTLAIAGGLLEGAGDVFANFVNGGVVSPGGDGAVGTLHIHGSYTQTTSGVLDIDLGGATSFDTLVIDGAANLAGALHVNLINGFTPSHGESFAILTFASHAGNFTSISMGFTDAFPDNMDMNLVAS